MGEAVTIKRENNIKLESFIKNYLNPKYVFLPIDEGYKLRVIDNSYVYKNDIVMFTDKGKSVHSSVSGRVLGIKDMLYSNGVKKSSLVIENDLKENVRVRKSARKYIDNYDRNSFLQILDDASFKYRGKYVVQKFLENKKALLINGIELEPYFGNKYFELLENADIILETVDLLSNIFHFEKNILAIKNNSSDIISNFMNELGTYPNIELKLMGDAYPNGMDNYLKKILELDDPLILSIEEVLGIYHILKKQIPVSEKLITITGNAVNPKCVIKVKLGSLLSEVFINNFDFTEKSVVVYLNGNMTGRIVDTLKFVIDSTVDGIVVMKKSVKQVENCISCGLCFKCCPMGLNPKYVFDHSGNVKSEYKEGCLQCGLCNYVCPSNIDLKSYMNGSEKN